MLQCLHSSKVNLIVSWKFISFIPTRTILVFLNQQSGLGISESRRCVLRDRVVCFVLRIMNAAAFVFLTSRAWPPPCALNLGLDGRPIKIDWSVAWLTWWWRGYCIIHVRPTTHQLSSCQSISADSTSRRGVCSAPTKFHIHPVDRTLSIFNSSKAHHLMRQNNCVFGAQGDAAGGRAAYSIMRCGCNAISGARLQHYFAPHVFVITAFSLIFAPCETYCYSKHIKFYRYKFINGCAAVSKKRKKLNN